MTLVFAILMIAQLSQSLIDELNLVKIDYDTDTDRLEYGFRDFIPKSGHLLWLYEDGSFGMAKQIIYMNNDDTHFWWGYTGAINSQTENEVRNHLYHLRTSIKKRIKECKERIVRRKLMKMQKDFV